MAAPASSDAGGDQVPSERRSRMSLTMVCAAGLLVLTAVRLGGHEPSPAVTDSAPRPPAAGQNAVPYAGTVSRMPRSTPVRLIIPKISVDAPFTTLALGADGHLQPPPAHDTNLVGWYGAGASPGERGTAIIAGHVDTTTSAAVFANLNELRKGDVFRIERADGRTASFVVDDAETFAKNDFPDERVYADSDQAQVRLITCAGAYDHTAKDYTENLVVFAHLL
ncbi:class F sortase [Streptomyces actuosus]|uniref:Class F sortase n=1 Tax=Streptomyces actuosus TaxID=1885 RepID=A0ABS2VK15_STRAS|nr:class F sortase [Streptomyces actuosus]MBN0043452.1 class F sortase [Streptomyces actuosus]